MFMMYSEKKMNTKTQSDLRFPSFSCFAIYWMGEIKVNNEKHANSLP